MWLFLWVLLSVLVPILSAALRYPSERLEESANTRGFKLPVSMVQRPQAHNLTSSSVLSSDVAIVNENEFAYLIPITIGGQKFPVILDTGSSDLWVVSSDCVSSDCTGVQRYNTENSTSSSISDVPFKLSYLVGSVSGNVGFETIDVGPYEISSQAFALINNTENLSLSSTGNSGILGLCFPRIAAIPPTSGQTFLENIFSGFAEDDRYFAYRLGRDSSFTDSNSSFTIGQLDPLVANDTSGFAYTPVFRAGSSDYDYWKLPLTSITLNNASFPISASSVPGAHAPVAVLDTGTTLILGPVADVDRFWQAVGSTRKDAGSGRWEIKCERGVVVGFTLGEEGSEREYVVHPGDMNWDAAGSTDGWCMCGMQGNDGVNSGDWLLGDIFLRNVYVTHHAATAKQPPLIGLLNMTDPSSSLAQFREQRGPDSSPPPAVPILNAVSTTFTTHTTAIYAVAALGGFLSGAALMSIFRERIGHCRNVK